MTVPKYNDAATAVQSVFFYIDAIRMFIKWT